MSRAIALEKAWIATVGLAWALMLPIWVVLWWERSPWLALLWVAMLTSALRRHLRG